MTPWKKQTWLLIGACGGIGRAVAKQLAALGIDLILTGRNADQLDALALELPTSARGIVADLTQAADVEKLVRAAPDSLDGIIFAAGKNDFVMFEDQDPNQIRQLFDINTLMPILVTQALLHRLSPTGRIIYVGSTLGSIGYPGYASYGATKAALRHFVQALRREYADKTWQFCYIAPRATRTSMNSENAIALNQALGSQSDSPEWVARQLIQQIQTKKMKDRHLGFPEKIFVLLNAMLPSLLDNALSKQLAIIQLFARSHNLDLVTTRHNICEKRGTK